MVLLTFSVLDGKHPFYANLVRTIKLVSLSLSFVPRLIKNLNMQNSVVVFTFFFRRETPFCANFDNKSQN